MTAAIPQNLPPTWQFTELKDIVDINPESRDPSQKPQEFFTYIDIDAVENGTGVITSVKELSGKDAPSRARRIVHIDDIILSEVRPYLKAFAIIPKILNNQICSTGFAVLRSNGEIDPHYLLYTLFSTPVIEQCNRMMVGAQYPALNDAQVKKIQIPLPPLPEQRRIATILSTVDDAIQRSRQAALETERLKIGVLHELMTKGIGHTEFREDPDVGTIPKEWDVKKIGKVSDIVTGGTPSTQHPEYYGGNIGWLKSGDIKGHYVFSTPENLTLAGVNNSNAKVHPAGGVAIALSGRGQTRGRTIIIKKPMACSQSVAIMLPDGSLSSEFLHYCLAFKYSEIRNLTGDNDRSGLNLKLVSNIQIPFPSLTEQQKIATILTTIDRKLSLQRQRIAHYEKLKQGLMNDLLTGRKRVLQNIDRLRKGIKG